MPPLPKGEALAGRFTFHWTTEARQDAKGRALLTGTAASGQRSLSSCRWPRQRSTAVSEILCFARPDESRPTCQWLPLWGNGDDRRQWRKQGGAVAPTEGRLWQSPQSERFRQRLPYQGSCLRSRLRGCTKTEPDRKPLLDSTSPSRLTPCHCPGCGSQRLLRCRSHPAGRGPNSSSLFPPLAAVVAVAPTEGRLWQSPQSERFRQRLPY